MSEHGLISDIQRYSLHDGPGIRTVVFLKGCPLSCSWCANPESQRPFPELMLTPEPCIDCGLCLQACAPSALTIRSEPSSVPKVEVDWGACDSCLACVQVCVTGTLQQVGRWMTVEQVLETVERDRPYYRRSNGGVTLSGGEPTMQPAFAGALLDACRTRSISTALETCGHCSWETLESLLPSCDHVFLDLKHLGPAEHERATGRTNARILENLQRLADCEQEVVLRITLIPGYNDDPQHLELLARRLVNLTQPLPVELIPHHRLGAPKYEHLDRAGQRDPYQACDPMTLERSQALLEAAGVRVAVVV